MSSDPEAAAKQLQLNNLGVLIDGLPSYADEADAESGGLTSGQLYITDGSAASPLNVAGIVMMKL